MTKRLLAAATFLGLSGLAASAHATVTYDTTLPTPPGVYYGSSAGANSDDNVNWAVDSESGIQLGLQGVIRFQGPVTPTGNVYQVSTGTGLNGQLWGFAFSAYDPSGFGNVTLSISVLDTAQGTTTSFDALAIPDNGAFDGTNTAFDCSKAGTGSICGAALGIQNAENPSFAFVDPGYNPWIADTYEITFTATNTESGDQIASVAIDVNAVPEPVSLSLLGAGLVGMTIARCRRKSAAQ